MKRQLYAAKPREENQKRQRSIRSMFKKSGPKFVEAVGLQLQCRYCNRKFKAPQGLVSHIHMHERANDPILHDEQSPNIRLIQPAPAPANVKDDVKQPASQPVIANEISKPVKVNINSIKQESKPLAKWSMTRRFTVAEKLRIIDKYYKNKNLWATCR